MLNSQPLQYKYGHGTTLLEVLVTIVILAFGLLGLAGLQSRVQIAELESYQRAQAIVLLSDMTERIRLNSSQAPVYVSASTFGTGDSQPVSCTGIAAGPTRDICEWSNSLKGVSEKQSSANIGAMLGARGCISQLQAPDTTLGVCKPGIYLVSVAWQGMGPTVAPARMCGSGLYGTDDSFRRLISSQLSVGVTSCQ
jgi:type IV pilus assembly protein PilV